LLGIIDSDTTLGRLDGLGDLIEVTVGDLLGFFEGRFDGDEFGNPVGTLLGVSEPDCDKVGTLLTDGNAEGRVLGV